MRVARPTDNLAAVTQRLGLAFYSAYLVSLEIPDAVDLIEYFEAGAPWPERRRVLASAGRAVRAMHDQGLVHADLHLKNLLVTRPAENPAVHILDWDKSTVSSSLTTKQRFSNLARLDRSGAKLARRGVAVTGRDRLAFLRAYQPGEALFTARDFQRMERTWAVHGLAWRMGDLLR